MLHIKFLRFTSFTRWEFMSNSDGSIPLKPQRQYPRALPKHLEVFLDTHCAPAASTQQQVVMLQQLRMLYLVDGKVYHEGNGTRTLPKREDTVPGTGDMYGGPPPLWRGAHRDSYFLRKPGCIRRFILTIQMSHGFLIARRSWSC